MRSKPVTIHPTKLLQAVRDARTPEERTRAIDECNRVLNLLRVRRWDYAVSYRVGEHMTETLARIVSRFPSHSAYEFCAETLEEAQACASSVERRLAEIRDKESSS